MLDWQPIATIPRDGTRVLCYRVRENGEREIQTAWYQGTDAGGDKIGGRGWFYPYGVYGDGGPTHWAPMPPGPHDTIVVRDEPKIEVA